MNESEHETLVRRINELARKAKSSGLTEAELGERDRLRKKYIHAFKTSLRNQLDQIEFVDKEPN